MERKFNLQAGISEIFSSVQGEGKYVGCRQLFIRFIGCNINCPYCDTDEFAHNKVPCELEMVAGYAGDFRLPNPLSLDDVLPYIKYRLQRPHHSISLTGGEPLLHVNAIHELGEKLGAFKVPMFLETNGILADNLAKVIDDIDIISMDIKLPSDIGSSYWREHLAFLQVAAKKDVYVKIVISKESTVEDFKRAVDIIQSVDKNILLVLQPITPMGGLHKPAPEKMLDWQELAMEKLRDVRVIPQTHKMINLR